MSATPSGAAAGVLLIVLGVWVLLQTIVGNLAGRILNLGTGTGTPSTNIGGSKGLGGGPETPGGSKIGATLTPAQQKQVQGAIGLPPGGNTPATFLPSFTGTPGAVA